MVTKHTKLKSYWLFLLPSSIVVATYVLNTSPSLTLNAVRMKPAINSFTGKPMKGYVDLEVTVDYHEPLIRRIFEPVDLWFRKTGVWLDTAYGVYVEDEFGVKHGMALSSQDHRKYRPFSTPVGPRGISSSSTLGQSKWSWVFRLPLSRIPKDSGKLTFKATLEAGKNTNSPVKLPLAITVRN